MDLAPLVLESRVLEFSGCVAVLESWSVFELRFYEVAMLGCANGKRISSWTADDHSMIQLSWLRIPCLGVPLPGTSQCRNLPHQPGTSPSVYFTVALRHLPLPQLSHLGHYSAEFN